MASRHSPWNSHSDAQSQADWQISLGKALNQSQGIIQASNSLQAPPTWGAATLIREQNATVMSFIKHFSDHNYPGARTIAELLDHTRMVKNVAQFDSDIKAARSIGREYVFGETNSGLFE
jgi:hypothetical protein